MKQIGVGILGFGTVGAGVADGLLKNRELMSGRLGVDITLEKIADLDLITDRGVAVDPAILTTDATAVINDPSIQIVVELIGGTGVARELVLKAFEAGKSVVTANKKLLAECGDEIFSTAERCGVDIYFGASVGGGIPIIRVLREGLAGNQISSMHGILNGTCNYILTRMENEHLPFDEVLNDAQQAGYAEAEPSLDVDGFDTVHKAAILASIAYGFHVPLASVPVEGISHLAGVDVQYAAEFGYRIKLLASINRTDDEVEVSVHPTLVPFDHVLASISDVFNAVMVNGDLSDSTLYYGRGAGREPTASTVIGDIGDVARNIVSGSCRFARAIALNNQGKLKMRDPATIESQYYVRLMVADKAGSLGTMTTILGSHGVSILGANQKLPDSDDSGGDYVPVVMLTHRASSAALVSALDEIYQTGVVREPPVKLRMI